LIVKHAGVHSKGTLQLSDIFRSVKSRPDYNRVGAMALFIGVVRGETYKGEKVRRLQLEAYEEQADKVLETICRNLTSKEGVVDVQIHHLTGDFKLGEDLVYVLVAGGHRQNVFPILQEAVERYKREAPIFKKEYVANRKGKVRSYWVSERGEM